ncbi:hypothetical protein [Aeromicrobium sp. UC242_57]|uniref:hypothetical protein n=1 Tax=Aeromicrobium sp. UC242_57 TaxID=3374624 RepID=UPI0037B301C3
MNDFGRSTLPYCSFVRPLEGRPRVGVGIETQVIDLTALAPDLVPQHAALFEDGSLDRFLAAGPSAWAEVRAALVAAVDTCPTEPVSAVELVLPFAVADYVDFYASEHHATNLGRMFRPDGEALMPNWKHLPVGYHGRPAPSLPRGRRCGARPGRSAGPTGSGSVRANVSTSRLRSASSSVQVHRWVAP